MKKVAQRAGGVIGVDGGKGVEGKKPGKIDLRKLLRLGVLGVLLLAGAVSAGAEPVEAKVVEITEPTVYNGNTLVSVYLDDNVTILNILASGVSPEQRAIIKSLRVGQTILYENSGMIAGGGGGISQEVQIE
jgi:hypothetical protein